MKAMLVQKIHPEGWKPSRGYSNAVLVAGAEKLLFVAGQIAWDAEQRLVGRGDFVAQMRQALQNVAAAPDLYHRDGPNCPDDMRTRSARLASSRSGSASQTASAHSSSETRRPPGFCAANHARHSSALLSERAA